MQYTWQLKDGVGRQLPRPPPESIDGFKSAVVGQPMFGRVRSLPGRERPVHAFAFSSSCRYALR